VSLAVAFLFWLLIALLFLLAGLLIAPVRFWVSLNADPGLRLVIIARPFGGVLPPLRIVDSTRKRKTKDKDVKKKRTQKKRKRRFVLRGPALVAALPDLISGLLRSIRIDSLSLIGEFGVGDPADTGHLYGILTPLIFGTAAKPDTRIIIRPNFDNRCLSGALETRLSMIPATLISPLLGFAWRVFGLRK